MGMTVVQEDNVVMMESVQNDFFAVLMYLIHVLCVNVLA